MRLFYPGQFALPATLLVAALFVILGSFGLIPPPAYKALLPFGLIAAGSEELYFWARSKEDR